MAERPYRVEVTQTFTKRLDAIEAFLADAGAAPAFDALLASLRKTVVPHLARFPRIGRRWLDIPPTSAEALALLTTIPPDRADALREYLHDDFLILYAVTDTLATVHLLSIRHHRELSYDFTGTRPGPG